MAFTGFGSGANGTPALLDDFNRADNVSLGASWSEQAAATMEIVSNAVKIVAGSSSQWAYWSALASSDLGSSITIATLSAVDFDPVVAAFVRDADPTTDGAQYMFYVRSPRTTIDVYRGTGVFDHAISLSATVTVADKIGVRCTDSGTTVSFQVWRDSGAGWVQIGSSSAVTRLAGPYRPGFGIYNNTTTVMDDFKAEAVSAVTSVMLPMGVLGLGRI